MNKTQIDARKMRCPMPLLKLKQGLAAMNVGDTVTVIATDAGSWRDIPAFIDLTNHCLLEQIESDGEYSFTVKKGE